jgi:hypothetical protein
VDLFPPPIEWLPPNCILEVDDVLQSWTWQEPFDLVHLRILEGSFTPEEQKRLYAEIYKFVAHFISGHFSSADCRTGISALEDGSSNLS